MRRSRAYCWRTLITGVVEEEVGIDTARAPVMAYVTPVVADVVGSARTKRPVRSSAYVAVPACARDGGPATELLSVVVTTFPSIPPLTPPV